MSTFHAQITVVNDTNDTLTLVQNESSGVDFNDWPAKLSPGKTYGPFSQGFNFQIKFTAAYANLNAPQPTPPVFLYMYGDGVQVFSVHINQSPSDPPPYPGSVPTVQGPTSAMFTISD